MFVEPEYMIYSLGSRLFEIWSHVTLPRIQVQLCKSCAESPRGRCSREPESKWCSGSCVLRDLHDQMQLPDSVPIMRYPFS